MVAALVAIGLPRSAPAADPVHDGVPERLEAVLGQPCGFVWAIPVPSEARRHLHRTCTESPTAMFRELQMLAGPSSDTLTVGALLQAADPLHRRPEGIHRLPPGCGGDALRPEQWWTALECAPNIEGLEANLEPAPTGHADAPLRRMFEAQRFQRAAGGHVDPDDYFYVTVRVGPSDTPLWVPDEADPTPIAIRGRVAAQVLARGLVYLAVPRGHAGWLTLSPGDAPPLVFRVDETLPHEKGGYVLDTLAARRRALVHLEIDEDAVAAIDGYPVLPCGYPADHGNHDCADDPGSGARVVDVPVDMGPSDARRVVVVKARKDSATPEVFIQAHEDVRASVSRSWRTSTAGKSALLPISAPDCRSAGIDEQQVTTRVKTFLGPDSVKDLGLYAAVVRPYVDAARDVDALPGAARTLGQGTKSTDAELSSALKDLYARGFRDVVDVRIACGRTGAGDGFYAVNAVRATLPPPDADDVDSEPKFRQTSKVVADPAALSDAISLVLGVLFDKPAMLMNVTHPREGAGLPLFQPYESRIELTEAAKSGGGASGKVFTAVYRIDDGSDLCERIGLWNQLRGEPSLTDLPAEREPDRLPTHQLKELPFDYAPRAPGRYVLRASLVHPARTIPTEDDMRQGLESFRCIDVISPKIVVGATYFSPTLLQSVDLPNPNVAESRSEWLVLGFAGPVEGLGASLGVSHRIRHGFGATTWDPVATIAQATTTGTVPYEVDAFSIYAGGVYSLRKYVSRNWTLNGRFFGMFRFDAVDTSGVPAALGSFTTRHAGSVFDFTFALTGDVSVRLIGGLSAQATALVGLPRASVLLFHKDEELQRTVFYDPTFLWLGSGLGASYSWD